MGNGLYYSGRGVVLIRYDIRLLLLDFLIFNDPNVTLYPVIDLEGDKKKTCILSDGERVTFFSDHLQVKLSSDVPTRCSSHPQGVK